MHQNIASILAKQELLELTLKDLQETNNTPDVICLSETFLRSGHENYLKIHGYELADTFCREKQRGGTCILTKRDIIYNKLNILKKHAMQKLFEVCGIEIVHMKLIIICLYRTPSSDPIYFLEKLTKVIEEIYKNKPKFKVVLTGDLNINTLKAGKVSNYFKDLCLNFNLKIHINVPTRKEACIDHILSNIEDATSSVLPLYLSDHETAQLLSIPVRNKRIAPKSYFIFAKDYSPENVNKFKECLKNISWSEVYDEVDFNSAFNKFHERLLLFYNLNFPQIRFKANNTTNKQKWITKGLKRSCKTKRFLRYQYYKNKTIVNKNRYLSYSKILKRCLQLSKRNTNIKFLKNSKNKCRATWSIIKNEISNKTPDDGIEKLKFNNTILTNPTDIATAFNSYFIESTNVSTSSDINFKFNINSNLNSLYLIPMTENEVIKEIMALNNTNSEGYDGISTRIIKMCSNELIAVLTYLINFSFSTGTFPESLKMSVVKPLFKKGEKDNIENYRPITLIPILSKVFEKCMYKRLLDYCNKFNIINVHQFGFQKRKSTLLAIYNLICSVLTSLNKNNLTTGLFFDLSKAFDFVSHRILLQKLELMGVRGLPLQWIKSYLSNRRQSVVIKKITNNELKTFSSELKENKFGVPQGSILGPILFLLYINDITQVTNHKLILFADDISIIVSSDRKINTKRDHEADINNNIDKIVEWLQINNLKINLDKCNFIQFNKAKQDKYSIKIEIDKIKETTQTKFLGLIIDQDLKWKTHIENLCSKINSFVYALRQIKTVTNLKTAVMTYRAYVESIIRYGIVLWGNSTDKNKIFIAQKKCIRAICGIASDVSCEPYFKCLGLLPLPSLYIFEICSFVRKHKSLFKQACDVNSRLKRDPYRLVYSDIPKSDKYGKSCLTMCIQIYNKLPKTIKDLDSNITFKNNLYKWLNENNFYDLKQFFDKV